MKRTAFFIVIAIGLFSCKKEPSSCFDIDNENPSVGSVVTFNNSCSQNAISQDWYMQGPSGAPENLRKWSEIEFTNAFTVSGEYIITCTVYNDFSWLGDRSVGKKTITVN